MSFDGFTLKSVVKELQGTLIGGKITKIYQPNIEEIVLGIYSHGKNYALTCNISFATYSLHLTTKSKPNPLSAPNFCMLLRKYLIGYKVKAICMTGLERIATIELEGYNELNDFVTLKLVLELMGKHSNIILVNQNGIIIDSLKHLHTFDGSYRNIVPNVSYQLPESNKLDLNTINYDFYDKISNEDKLTSISTYFMEHFTGISKILLESIMESESYKKEVQNDSDSLSYENFKLLLSNLQNLYNKIENEQICCMPFNDDYVLAPCNDSSSFKVNFFLDDYYYEKEQLEEFTMYRNSMLAFIMKKLKKISKKLDGVNDKIKECSKMDEFKLYGELITNNLYKIDNKHIDNIVLENYYNQNETVEIPLDASLSPSDNAKKYFKKYHKLKNTIDIVTSQKIELENEIDYLESIVYELQVTSTISDIDHIYDEMENNNLFSRKTKSSNGSKEYRIKDKSAMTKHLKFLKHRKSYSSGKQKNKNEAKSLKDFLSYTVDDFKVLVGKNNQENDILSLKIAKENDLWFHVKDMQGSHVILVIQSKEPSQETINKVAGIAAYYSRAKQSSNVPVDYTLARYVKKPSKAKPGMVIYTNQKTVNVQPVCL